MSKLIALAILAAELMACASIHQGMSASRGPVDCFTDSECECVRDCLDPKEAN